jgi:hypothetical protein
VQDKKVWDARRNGADTREGKMIVVGSNPPFNPVVDRRLGAHLLAPDGGEMGARKPPGVAIV